MLSNDFLLPEVALSSMCEQDQLSGLGRAGYVLVLLIHLQADRARCVYPACARVYSCLHVCALGLFRQAKCVSSSVCVLYRWNLGKHFKLLSVM